VRAVTEADPYDVAQRHFLARLYLKLGDREQARAELARLLPLCVGRGDLFRALSIQKQLDALEPYAARAGGRYEAMHRWFRSLGGTGATEVREGASLQPAFLLLLAPDAFARAAEGCVVEGLEPGMHELEGAPGTLCVALLGDLWCPTPGGDIAARSGRELEEHHYLLMDPTRDVPAPLSVQAHSPAELLRFPGELMLELAAGSSAFADGIARLMPDRAGSLAARREALGAVLHVVQASPLPGTEREGAGRRGDPESGPVAASQEHGDVAPPRPTLRLERRGTQRFAVSLAGQVAVLARPGVSGGPFQGRVRDLSTRGVCMTVGHAEAGPALRPLLNSLALVDVAAAPGEPALRLCAWLRWCRRVRGEWAVGMEFAGLTTADRRALERLIPTGTPPDPELRFQP
jgi:CRP-like cAMP-binding protein